ncbi:MAG: UDP-3-O-(3-hydroxymyristoyl)glucosamine N-acyltransferase, partial [Saprospiraceae bacterium]
RVDDVYASLAVLMNNFNQIQHEQNHTISANSEIHATAAIGEGTHVGAYTVIEKNVNIGNGCRIGSNVYIGKDCKIGKNVILFSGVRIYYDCEIGDNCILHANAVIGSDGFGFAPQPDGTYKKIYQLGNVLIGNDVEIGANSTLDRASMGSTIIHDGVKIDNLVHVAHNVEIGKNTVIAAQTGVAGSTKIGENCMIGGQVGFAGHIKIADGTKIQAQSGIARSIETPNTAVFGSPAIPYTDFIKSYSVFQKLPDLYRKLTQLERKIEK